MKVTLNILEQLFEADLTNPLDISVPLHCGPENIHAWYVGDARFEAVENGHWIGDVNRGGAVNFRDIYFNPHGHGTHTECVGHISKEPYTINRCLTTFFFPAQVVTVTPTMQEADQIITTQQVQDWPIQPGIKAIIIRTLPNDHRKSVKHYSGTNPPYMSAGAVNHLLSLGIDHLLIDLPSIDRELDEGKLLAHHAFWEYPANPQTHRTITELIFVKNDIPDGLYLLNLQISSFENDASPSKPLLFNLREVSKTTEP